MSAAPAVSVIVTCFNLGRFLAEAVDSVLGQTVQDVEILITDDGSDEAETIAILDRFERPHTRVFRTENKGLGAARNFLIQQARGTYLCALDADDRLDPSFFEKTLAAFAADPGLSFVSSWEEAFGAESWVWRQDRCDLPALLAECTVLTAALVRREAVLAVGGYDEHMPHPGDEDWELWLRLVEAGHRGTILPEVLFYYRRRADQMSRDCVEGDTHLELVRYLVSRHRASFAAHLAEVVRLRDRHLAQLVETNRRLERDLAHELGPDVVRRRAELAALHDRLAALRAGRPAADAASPPTPTVVDAGQLLEASAAELAVRYLQARHEVEQLRASLSWRVTAPLRAAWEVLLKFRGLR